MFVGKPDPTVCINSPAPLPTFCLMAGEVTSQDADGMILHDGNVSPSDLLDDYGMQNGMGHPGYGSHQTAPTCTCTHSSPPAARLCFMMRDGQVLDEFGRPLLLPHHHRLTRTRFTLLRLYKRADWLLCCRYDPGYDGPYFMMNGQPVDEYGRPAYQYEVPVDPYGRPITPGDMEGEHPGYGYR
ncbi:Hypp4934 [Branchiostoma lanceolatum]|uniref:Hypp4934 protein n=1 Tax=Branchiostoma lanceolatum TaxID=7740 RepID=A0A8K0AE42_BRALA|nr:Hypp4934 [Branchiostoma lanceolatum]